MSSITSLSSASGLTVMSLAQAKSQHVLDDITERGQAMVESAQGAIVMKLSSSGFQSTVITALNSESAAGQENSDFAAYYAKYNSMTSENLSSMLYAGGGFQRGASNETFSTDMATEIASAESMAQSGAYTLAWVAAGRPNDAAAAAALNPYAISKWTSAEIDTWQKQQLTTAYADFTDEQVNVIAENTIESQNEDVETYNQASAAFANKTLTIEKASDVDGFDYRETAILAQEATGVYVQRTNSYNEDFIRVNQNSSTSLDGKSHMMVNMGPTMLYLSW